MKKLLLHITTLILLIITFSSYQNVHANELFGSLQAKDVHGNDITMADKDWHLKAIHADAFHDIGIKGEGIKIAVFEESPKNHTELLDKNITFVSCYEKGDVTPNSNDCTFEKGYETDHATQTTSLILSSEFGVAPNVEMYSVNYMDGKGQFQFQDDFQRAMNWAIDNKVDIINLSIAFTEQQFINGAETEEEIEKAKQRYETFKAEIDALIEKAYNNNILIIASSGNADVEQLVYPASHDKVIAVGALDIFGHTFTRAIDQTSGSSYGEELDFMAPGYYLYVPLGENDYTRIAGTSFSAPIVSGYFALLKEYYNEKGSPKTNTQLIEIAKNNAIQLTDFRQDYKENLLDANYNNTGYGYGMIFGLPTEGKINIYKPTTLYRYPSEHAPFAGMIENKTEQEFLTFRYYQEWNGWYKIDDGSGSKFWIDLSEDLTEITGEPITARDVYVDENTKAYAFPWEDGTNVDLSEHITQGIYPATRGYIEVGNSINNSKITKNYLWYQIQIGGHSIWVKAHAVHELKSIQYITFQTTEALYDYPSLTAPKQSYSRGYTIYSYHGYDYNQEEKRFNWYSINTSQGLKWYPSQYHLYQTQKLPESNGFEDGVITSWNDYMTSDFIQNWRATMRNDTFNHAQFEEKKLFLEQDFNAIYEQYKQYPFRYIAVQKRIGSNDHVVSLFFSNAEMYVDNTSSYSIYRARDNSKFIRAIPSKNDNNVRNYVVNYTDLISTDILKWNTEITLYSLNLD